MARESDLSYKESQGGAAQPRQEEGEMTSECV